jgi:hypothetical protein
LKEVISGYIIRIREENNIDEQVRLLKELNTLLPEERKLPLPSLFTRDYISKAVNTIEEIWIERIMPPQEPSPYGGLASSIVQRGLNDD